jgi:hypothetical protein
MTNETERRWSRPWALVAVIIGLGFASGGGCQGCGSSGGSTDARTDAKKDQAAAEAPGADVAQDTATADAAQDTASTDVAQEMASADTATETASADTATETASADAIGDGAVDGVAVVGTFGCFARSGDGADFFESGKPAVIVTDSPWRVPCDLAWISTNAHGYAPQEVPVTEILTRTFVVDSLISDRATFTISFEVDDAAEIVLNGHVVASCTPPEGNAGLCQFSCQVATLNKADFMPVGQPNQLQIKMINLQSGNAGGGNFGWSGISYSICATGE